MHKLTVEDLVMKFRRPIVINAQGCWIWLGSVSSQGYALMNHSLVHGIVFRLVGRECDVPLVVCHTCATKLCVNPDHLYAGTYSDNVNDAVLDGTRGKVGKEGYRMIFELYRRGISQAEIARRTNVSRSLVSKFFKGEILNFQPDDFLLDEWKNSRKDDSCPH